MAAMPSLVSLVAVLAFVLLDCILNPEPVLLTHRQAAGRRAVMLNAALTVVFRVALGLVLFWLSQRDTMLFTLGAEPVALADLVFLAAGALLLVRVFSELIQVSYQRLSNTPPAVGWSGRGALAMAALIGAVEPASMGLGLLVTWPALVAALTLGGIALAVLARPIARLVHRFPHMRLLALALLGMVGASLVLQAFGLESAPGILAALAILLVVAGAIAAVFVGTRHIGPGVAVLVASLIETNEGSRRDRSRGAQVSDTQAREEPSIDEAAPRRDQSWWDETPVVADAAPSVALDAEASDAPDPDPAPEHAPTPSTDAPRVDESSAVARQGDVEPWLEADPAGEAEPDIHASALEPEDEAVPKPGYQRPQTPRRPVRRRSTRKEKRRP